jgi:phosphoribosylformylglycinamidine cyclo-ligase
MTLGECLLTPTKIYVKQVLDLIKKTNVKSISNITGGGFYENIPRALKENVSVKINKNSYEIPEIFKLIQKEGKIPEKDMYNTFNMGIGMVVIISEEDALKAIEILKEAGEEAYIIGEVVQGDKEVILV